MIVVQMEIIKRAAEIIIHRSGILIKYIEKIGAGIY